MSEILAPVGGLEQLRAAVACGADAVYFGAKDFNARKNADNFDDLVFSDAVRYCHVRGVKVYATVNTLVFDDELNLLETAADQIAEAGVDGVIIQDLAVLDLFLHRYPGIERIASTQMAVHNVSGVKQLELMGFTTAVLARELSKNEIQEIVRATSLKTEVFVHGAHCMSVSGMCYVSSMLGGRSGNRGLCAQPCRLDWKSGDISNALSLKDMSLIDHLRELSDMGVDSFKIEGRMKRPEYVAAAVTACRKALRGEDYDEKTLRSVFSRSGFTDGYFSGRRDASMFGNRTKDDVIAASSVLKSIEQLYRNEQPRIVVDMMASVSPEEFVLILTDQDGNRAEVRKEGSEPALNKALEKEDLIRSLSKLGNTPFKTGKIDVSLTEGQFIGVSAINQIRREAVEKLSSLRGNREVLTVPYRFETCSEKTKPFAEKTERWARVCSTEQYRVCGSFDCVIISVDVAEEIPAEQLQMGRTILELPAVLFPEDEEKMFKRISCLREKGIRRLFVNNLYGLKYAHDSNMIPEGGYGLNVVNSLAAKQYGIIGLNSLCVSFELSADRIRKLFSDVPVGMIVYGRVPLMHFRNCPVRASVGCAVCGAKGKLTDRFGISFPVECYDKKYSVLLNSVPICLSDQRIPPADYTLFWFTRETPSQITSITDLFEKHRKPDFPRTLGLYFREVQ